MAAIEAHPNTSIASEEAERLKPWFSAASVYLTRALKEAGPEIVSAQEKETLKTLITPGALKKQFNDVATFTRDTLTSDVVIMPDNIRKGPAWRLFMSTFNPTFEYGNRNFSFGFLKLFEGGRVTTAQSSTTIPTFMLDAKLMEEIAPHQPAELYRRFQLVATDMNHDMLHHLHSPAITTAVAHKFNDTHRTTEIYNWYKALPTTLLGPRIEEWSQVSHGKIFMTPENAHLVNAVRENVDFYFDELDRISEALPKERAHEIVDYFGTVMLQTLSRTFPFNHPLMMQCLDRLEDAEPLSEQELKEDALAMYLKIPNKDLALRKQDPSLEAVRKDTGKTIQNIIEGYRKQGLDILPDDDNAVSYAGLKLLQLAKMEPDDMRSHVPSPVTPQEQKMREESDRAFLDLVSAIAKTTAPRNSK